MRFANGIDKWKCSDLHIKEKYSSVINPIDILFGTGAWANISAFCYTYIGIYRHRKNITVPSSLRHVFAGLTHRGRNKMATISQMISSNAFSWMKTFEFWTKSHWNMSLWWSNWQYSRIGSDNGLAPHRRQANIWSNAWMRHSVSMSQWLINSSSPGQNGCHLADDIFKRILLNEKVLILIKISLKFVLRVHLTITQHWFR